MMTYGYTIHWTDKNGDRNTLTVKGRSTREEAENDAIKEARKFGWRPKKWYQFGRMDDTTIQHTESD